MSIRLSGFEPSQSPPGARCIFNDGLEFVISYKTLRDDCPCAPCLQEKRHGQSGRTQGSPLQLPAYKPMPDGYYEVKGYNWVGSYAINLLWGDGHNTGIYPFEYLRRLVDQERNFKMDPG